MGSSNFEINFQRLVPIEGDYSNDKNDSGGETRYGITLAVARANGYSGQMSEMPITEAARIYKAQFWDILRLDAVADVSPAIASELFDTSVNMGVAISGSFLQRALNAFNRQQTDYPDVKVDGIVGPGTLYALKEYLRLRGKGGEVVMLRALNSLQGNRYIELTERRTKDESFLFGWFRTRVSVA